MSSTCFTAHPRVAGGAHAHEVDTVVLHARRSVQARVRGLAKHLCHVTKQTQVMVFSLKTSHVENYIFFWHVRHHVTSLTHELQRADLAASHHARRPRRDLALAHDLITWRDVDGDEHARVGRVGPVVADSLEVKTRVSYCTCTFVG